MRVDHYREPANGAAAIRWRLNPDGTITVEYRTVPQWVPERKQI